jgi:hypothetical protein
MPHVRSPQALGWVWLACVSISGLLAGCSSEGRPAPAVNPVKAREVVNTVLDGWKKGDSIESLKSASPSITVQDFDWMGGSRLMAYEVVGEGKSDDANLRVPVKLTLKTPEGKEVTKSVSYVVGTGNALTMFRELKN